MKQMNAPQSTPSPKPRETRKPHATKNKAGNPSTVFVTMALDMSWRLAIVVLVPIVGGFELDQHFQTAPLLAIVGFVLAMAGMALVLWRMLQTVNALPAPKREKRL